MATATKTAITVKKGAPVKTTLNLYVKEKKELSLSRLIPGLLAVLAAAALFGKFAVLDRYAAVTRAEAALAGHRAALESLQQSYADFDEVQAEYQRYTYTGYDRTIVDRLDVLALLEREVFPMGGVENLAISGKTLTMTLTGLTLDQMSTLISRLEADPLVSGVIVSTAGYASTATGEDVRPRANVTVDLADAIETEGGEAE